MAETPPRKRTIAGRYEVKSRLGKGTFGTTYAAIAPDTRSPVAVKVVSLRQIGDWKVLELLEREAKILAHLHHPAIPRYLDYFYRDTDGDRRFYLVQELIEGKSLAKWVERGWHPSEAKVKAIAGKVLEILDYLHHLVPPIIHRDIKPQNIIRRRDGKIYLVDFGSVQDVYRNTLTSGGTFVGTWGYMPPEQFRGRVQPASDLYALGTTLLFLLTGRSPEDFPQRRLKLQFRPHVNISPEFADWLERMLEPAVEDRFDSAEAAIAALEELSRKRSPSPRRSIKQMRMRKTGDRLVVDILPERKQGLGFVLFSHTLLFGSILLYGFRKSLSFVYNPILILGLMTTGLFGVCLLLLWGKIRGREHLEFGDGQFLIYREHPFFVSKAIVGKLSDVVAVRFYEDKPLMRVDPTTNPSYQDQYSITYGAIWHGGKKYVFAGQCDRRDQERLIEEITEFWCAARVSSDRPELSSNE